MIKKKKKDHSVFPFMLAANVYFIQAGGRSGLLQFLELRVCTEWLLLELLQVNINGVTLRL